MYQRARARARPVFFQSRTQSTSAGNENTFGYDFAMKRSTAAFTRSQKTTGRVLIFIIALSSAVYFYTTSGVRHVLPCTKSSRMSCSDRQLPQSGVPPAPTVDEQHTVDASSGYILVLNASDQLTGGGMNIMSLQCLVGWLGDAVLVEPFVVGSTFGARLLADPVDFARENNVRLSDVYDLEDWNEHAKFYRRFSDWEDFLQNAPRDLILVENQWWQECDLKARVKQFEPFFLSNGFRVVQSVCSNFKYSGVLTTDQYKEAIYGSYPVSNVTVVITRFPGICAIGKHCEVDPFSTSVQGTGCDKQKLWQQLLDIGPGQKIIKAADKYIRKYLGGKIGYISLMIRLEIAATRATKIGYGNDPALVTSCLDRLKKKLNEVKNGTIGEQLHYTFLTVDVGRYGSFSNTLREYYADTLAQVKNFIHSIYQGSISFDEWEDRFPEVSGLKLLAEGTRGFVAMLQKEIARRGRCLIAGGGGSFQSSTVNLYKSSHSKHCYIVFDNSCHLQDQVFQ